MNIIPRRTQRNRLALRHSADDLFGEMLRGFNLFRFPESDWAPSLDVHETDSALVVKVDLPGVTEDDLEITLEDGVLTIKGEKNSQKEEEGKNWHRIERASGSFVRRLSLPDSIDPEQIKASRKDGVVSVSIGKKAEVKPRKIEVAVEEEKEVEAEEA